MLADRFNLGSIIRRYAKLSPDAPCLTSSTGTMNYLTVNQKTNRLANAMKMAGICHGDRVAILMENNSEYVLMAFALGKLGAIMVPINIRLHPKEIEHILEDAIVSGLFISSNFQGLFEDLPDRMSHVRFWLTTGESTGAFNNWEKFIETSDIKDPDVAVNPDDTLLILYTSGTTGKPKGCMLTHRNWITNNQNVHSLIHVLSNDVYLAFLPFFHVAGFGVLLAHLHKGAHIVFGPKQFDPSKIYDLCEEHKVTCLFLINSLIKPMLYHTSFRFKAVKSLRTFITGLGIQNVH